MTKKTIVPKTIRMSIMSCSVPALRPGMKLRIKSHYHSEYQKILRGRQAGHSGPDFSAAKKAASWAARIVNPVFQPENCRRLLIRDSIFQRGGVGLHRLSGPRRDRKSTRLNSSHLA